MRPVADLFVDLNTWLLGNILYPPFPAAPKATIAFVRSAEYHLIASNTSEVVKPAYLVIKNNHLGCKETDHVFFDPAKSQKNIRVSTLREWLDGANGNRPEEWHVALLMIQRGFVCKPSQIIQLWDTLFQGLPFGALLVSDLPKDAQSIALVGRTQSFADLG